MTNTRKTTTEPETTPTETTPTETTDTVIGPPLRPRQTPEKITFAHHLHISGRDFQPGDTALVSPDYARQLRGNGYIARGRG